MLERMRCELELKLRGAEDGAKIGTFSGYGAVFNSMDGSGDVIKPGAFKASLKEWRSRGKLPKMLLQHGSFLGPAEDGIPIGRYTEMDEDAKGLKLEGELFALDTQKGKYIYEGIKSGELDGLSIGFRPVDVTLAKKPTDPRRTLNKIDLREVSIVTFPMHDKAGITGVKFDGLMSLAECEDYLRDACGFSKQQAVSFVSRIKSLGSLSDSGDGALIAAVQMARQLRSKLNLR